MKIKQLINKNGNPQKAVSILDNEKGVEVLTHYGTPVAAYIRGRGYIKTNKKWSNTTSKNINLYVYGEVEEVSQEELDEILKEL